MKSLRSRTSPTSREKKEYERFHRFNDYHLAGKSRTSRYNFLKRVGDSGIEHHKAIRTSRANPERRADYNRKNIRVEAEIVSKVEYIIFLQSFSERRNFKYNSQIKYFD